MNTTTIWRKASVKENELVNYEGYVHEVERPNGVQKVHHVEFRSAADIVQCSRHNIEHCGWTDYRRDGNAPWRYGDYKNAEATADSLDAGRPLPEHFAHYEQLVEKLYASHPQLSDLEQRARRSKRRRSYNDFDGEVCIDRYLAFNDSCFERMTRRPSISPACRIVYYMPTSAGTEPKEFFQGIASACAVAQIVQAAGLVVKVTLALPLRCLQDGYTHSVFAVTLKDYEEDLDIARLLSAGASGLFREYIFSSLKHIADNYVSGGLGFAVARSEIKNVIAPLFESDISIFGNDAMEKAGIEEVIKDIEKVVRLGGE